MSKLEEFNENIKGKRVAIIGLGVSNLPLIKYFNDLDCEVVAFDNRDLEKIEKDTINKLEEYNCKYYTGQNALDDLKGFDYIFRSPSARPDKPEFLAEIERGAVLTTEIEQVLELSPSHIIGITGSDGKTTTTSMIYQILKNAGKRCFLGGNIGTPLFTEIKDMMPDDYVVLELSSFQLMNMKKSPEIAVITNITPNHLDIHKDYQEYIDAKKTIFINQDENGILVTNKDNELTKDFDKEAKGHIRYFSTHYLKDTYILENDFITYNKEKIIDTRNLLLKGSHNYLNICTALNTIKDYINVSNEQLQKIIEKINPVHHRLEYIRTINNVKWYNDSASTTPDKALAGINAFKEKIVLIAGGYDKNISYEPLAKPIANKVSKLILFGETKNKIYNEIMKLPKELLENLQIYILDTLEEVVEIASKVSEEGEVVLFSPASASFDMFQNAYQRGDLFKELVKKI